jgi:putative glutamine amidotransferase
MPNRTTTIRIAIFGDDKVTGNERHGCGLWAAGVPACVTAAQAEPVRLPERIRRDWEDILEGVHGVVITGHDEVQRRYAAEADDLCAWCHDHKFPLLGIDHGMHALNTSHGGTIYMDLPRDLPDALQHRHPPERGLRHAINVVAGTQLAELYGEGEVVVNSEHRRAVQRLARGFRVGAHALDGVVESIEAEEGWFALGVQWHPASATASGLDIQVFRGLVDACVKRWNLVREIAGAAA